MLHWTVVRRTRRRRRSETERIPNTVAGEIPEPPSRVSGVSGTMSSTRAGRLVSAADFEENEESLFAQLTSTSLRALRAQHIGHLSLP